MAKKLTVSEIKAEIKKEKGHLTHSYHDEADILFNQVLELKEKGSIDEEAVKFLITTIIASYTKETIVGLRNDLIKKNFLQLPQTEQNKLLFVNYSRHNYA